MNNIVDKINKICQDIKNIKINKVEKNKGRNCPDTDEGDEVHCNDSLYNIQSPIQSNNPNTLKRHETTPIHNDLPPYNRTDQQSKNPSHLHIGGKPQWPSFNDDSPPWKAYKPDKI